jgi:uncharacterized protein YerC
MERQYAIVSTSQYSLNLITIMGTYRYIPEEQKQLILTMCLRGMKVKDIVEATGMSRTTIFRVKRNWGFIGRVVRKSLEHGRPRVLSSLEVSVRALSEVHEKCSALTRRSTWKV